MEEDLGGVGGRAWGSIGSKSIAGNSQRINTILYLTQKNENFDKWICFETGSCYVVLVLAL